MFEFIGIVVAVVIAWKILSSIISGAIRGHMLRSVDHAVSQGVPYEFASKMIQHREIIKQSIKHLGDIDKNFRLKDAYEQQGDAIIMLYHGYLSEQKA